MNAGTPVCRDEPGRSPTPGSGSCPAACGSSAEGPATHRWPAPTPEELGKLRSRLLGLAYRMVGTLAEAEDITQEAFARYAAHLQRGGEPVRSPRAFLAKVVTRLCLDYLRSARAQRERYPGQWLPEPLSDEAILLHGLLDPAQSVEQHEAISFALLVLLQSLSPAERAVFLLREVFEFPYEEIAVALGRSEASCRQLFHRARKVLQGRRVRTEPAAEDKERLVRAFVAACRHGDLSQLVQLLTHDATAVSDGGGRVPAARRPVVGEDRVARFFLGLAAKYDGAVDTLEVRQVNGEPAVLVRRAGRAWGVLLFGFEGQQVSRLWMVLNPDKLRAFVDR